jgi:hypothetical protein
MPLALLATLIGECADRVFGQATAPFKLTALEIGAVIDSFAYP